MRIRAVPGALLLLFLFGGLAHSAAPNRIRRRLGGAAANLATRTASAQSQYWSIADNATLSMGANIDMTIAGWIFINSYNGANPSAFGKWLTTGNQREYLMSTNTASQHFGWTVSTNGVSAVQAIPAIAVTTGVWHFIACTYDGTNIKCSIDGASSGTGFASTAFSTDIFDGTAELDFGQSNPVAVDNFDGTYDAWGIWKSTRGNGGALSAAQITALYNGGIGYSIKNMPSSLKAALVAGWDWDGSGRDAVGASNLIPVNGPSFVAGVPGLR